MTPLDVNTDPLSFEVPVTPTIEQAESEELGEPILFGEIDTPRISPKLLPDWLCDYVSAVSEHTQTPVEMAIMYSLSVVATCLQGKVEISPDGSDYTEPVNIWTVTALPPASRKSAVVKALTFPLTDWEKAEAEKLKPLIEEREAERLVNQKRISELQSKAAKLESAQERSQLIREIGNLKTSTPDEMRAPQLFSGDVTPEQLQNMLVDHGEKMSILSDEGGIFEVMTGLYNDGKSNIDVFLQAHAGTSVRVNRAQRSVMLDNPALTFGLTVQPEVIASLSKGDKRRLRGVGALARFLYCIPESNIGSRDATRTKPIPEHVRYIYRTNIEHLLKTGQTDLLSKSPIKLTLNPDALSAFHAFAQAIENDQGPGRKYENIQDWTGKLPGAALRIAALFHVAEYGTKPEVSFETMDKAAELCTLLIPHTEKAFELMSREPSLDDAKYLWDWLVREGKPGFLKRDAHRLPRFVKSPAVRVHGALDILVERNLISGRQYLDTKKPTQYHTINPICLAKRGGLVMSWQSAAHGILTTPAINDAANLQEPARISFLRDKADKVDKDHPKLSPSQISHLGDKADKADKVSSALSPPRNTHLLTCATGLRSVMRDSKRRQVPLPPVAFQLIDELINQLNEQASVNETFPYRPEISPIAE